MDDLYDQEHLKESYKLIAPNVFDYLQLVEFVNLIDLHLYNVSLDKENLTIYIDIYPYVLILIGCLLPDGILIKKNKHEIDTFYI